MGNGVLSLSTLFWQIVKEDKALVCEDWEESIQPLMDSIILKLDPIFFGLEQYFAAKSLIASRSFEIDEYHGSGMVPLADMYMICVSAILGMKMEQVVAAAIERVQLVYNGDKEVSWSEACSTYGRFCSRMKLGLIVHSLVLCCFLVLAVISACCFLGSLLLPWFFVASLVLCCLFD